MITQTIGLYPKKKPMLRTGAKSRMRTPIAAKGMQNIPVDEKSHQFTKLNYSAKEKCT